MQRITAYVRGRVQGVSFRYYTQIEARHLGLTGWVRNERDGSVLVVAEGSKDRLSAIIEFLHQGPRSASVDNVEVSWSAASQMFENFEIRWL